LKHQAAFTELNVQFDDISSEPPVDQFHDLGGCIQPCKLARSTLQLFVHKPVLFALVLIGVNVLDFVNQLKAIPVPSIVTFNWR
jgi:hypothetical protein